MGASSLSFSQAGTDLADWIEGVVGHRPKHLAAGRPAPSKTLALSPYKLEAPMAAPRDTGRIQAAEALFCLSIGGDAPDQGCAWYDAIFFAAQISDATHVSDTNPPAQWWTAPPGLMLTLTRRVERATKGVQPKIVREPLIFDLTRDPERLRGERT